MLARRLRLRPNIEPSLGQRLVFAVHQITMLSYITRITYICGIKVYTIFKLKLW